MGHSEVLEYSGITWVQHELVVQRFRTPISNHGNCSLAGCVTT